jgi:hypothetical protein
MYTENNNEAVRSTVRTTLLFLRDTIFSSVLHPLHYLHQRDLTFNHDDSRISTATPLLVQVPTMGLVISSATAGLSTCTGTIHASVNILYRNVLSGQPLVNFN